VLYSHNGYNDNRIKYENGLYSAKAEHTGLSLLSVESQTEGLIGE